MTIKLLDVRYIGWVKKYPQIEAANGYSNGGWTVMLTKSALYQFFGIAERPGEAATLYNTLGIVDISTQDEIKKSYRRLALQWHPDTCKEKDARQQFDAIKDAYDILSNPTKRAKYNAGLALQATLSSNIHSRMDRGESEDPTKIYRSPLRCGYILADGNQQGAKFVVDKILQWQDIKNALGQTLIVSWQRGHDTYTESWV